MVHPARACNRIPAAFGVALNAPVQEAEPRCRSAAAKHEFHAVAVPDNELLCMLELHFGILALLGSQQRASDYHVPAHEPYHEQKGKCG